MQNNVYSLDNIILENSNLVHYVCSKYQGYTDMEDLYQVGVIGLIKAYKNYDETKEVKFSTYAYSYIIGEISNYVRENKVIKLSRDLIRLGRKIKEYREKHLKVRGYEPSVSDIALMLNVKEDKVISALLACDKSKSLDEKINSDGKELTLLDRISNDENLSNDTLLDLKEAFSYLSNDEKKLVINRYYKDLTQKDVAELMGVNQVYVSRLEKKVLKKMKSKMAS